MKLWRVNFPFFIVLGVFFLWAFIPVFGQTKNQTSWSQGKQDSIARYYQLSKSDLLSLEERLKNVSIFLKGAWLSQNDSLVYNGLMQKTMLLGRVRQYDSAIIYTHQLYDLAKNNFDTLYIENAYRKLGIYYKKNDQLSEAFHYYNKAFIIARKKQDTIKIGRNLLNMANIQATLGDYSGSKTTAIDGVKYLENSKQIKNLSGLYHIISVANRYQKNYKDALIYNKKAQALGADSVSIEKIKLKNILIFKCTEANILADKMDYTKALPILKELAINPVVKKDSSEYARVLNNLGYILWLENKKNITSEVMLIKALKIREQIKDIEGLSASNIHLTEYYFNVNKDKALTHAKEAYKNAKKYNGLKTIMESLGFIIELKENTNKEAREFKEVSNTLQEVNQSNREMYAVTKYENDKLANENLTLKAEKAKKERQQIIYLFTSLFVILSTGVVFYLLRQRHKREKIREVYNAEARISKRLHDELANDVYHVMNQVQNHQNSQEVLDKLEHIYNRTRDISRENNSFDIGPNFAQELSAMLSSFGSWDTQIIIKDIDEINWQAITPEKKIIVHRALQELMVNMKKHSEAGLVAITFKKEAKKVLITYADNGIGVSEDDIIYCNGLKNTENRIKTIGGSFIFDTDKGKGFKAKMHFPS